MLHFNLISLFPEFFESPLDCGLMARAQQRKIVSFSMHNPRDFSNNKHRHVDDRPFGGGPGMVMQIEPLTKTIRSIDTPGRIIMLTPQGYPFDQKMARALSLEDNLTLICGRYEGIDARIADIFPLTPVSVGDVVLNGGETAALAMIEAISRLRPGYMGKEASGEEESFSYGCLEYPHYSRPETFEGHVVPEELLSGNHALIAYWRRKKALAQTWRYRPEMLDVADLSQSDLEILKVLPRLRPGRNLSFCLVHHPVQIDRKKEGISSLTNLDIHDIARISASYGMGMMFVVTPLQDQKHLLQDLLRHWTLGRAAKNHPDRARALRYVRVVASIDEAIEQVALGHGIRPCLVASSASWPRTNKNCVPATPGHIRNELAQKPVLLFLGTAQGLAESVIKRCDMRLRPLRFLDYNHLSVRSAAAILADRILGDFR